MCTFCLAADPEDDGAKAGYGTEMFGSELSSSHEESVDETATTKDKETKDIQLPEDVSNTTCILRTMLNLFL